MQIAGSRFNSKVRLLEVHRNDRIDNRWLVDTVLNRTIDRVCQLGPGVPATEHLEHLFRCRIRGRRFRSVGDGNKQGQQEGNGDSSNPTLRPRRDSPWIKLHRHVMSLLHRPDLTLLIGMLPPSASPLLDAHFSRSARVWRLFCRRGVEIGVITLAKATQQCLRLVDTDA